VFNETFAIGPRKYDVKILSGLPLFVYKVQDFFTQG
jgi:hypothetical protein